MNILILGDIMGPSGREAIIKKLPNLIKKKKIDFVIYEWRKCCRSWSWNNKKKY